ncbi:hypothetical protein [Siphonobacter aquaeclarae]|jgi:hypothetical protein|uniref:Uncharacterized protein n=1 Tax=Siphonobacter aquaeclarae TaxID=563176 RepID=A0A1G9MEE9_9BACT|nr:hypothetical protein [Siphonobacter aquaeclarae]SDL72483.1 hypothetical protein SAMN04488090_1564 [Siphonobacter aquaeclarae]
MKNYEKSMISISKKKENPFPDDPFQAHFRQIGSSIERGVRQDIREIGTRTLVITGSLLAAYALFEWLMPGEEERPAKTEERSTPSFLAETVKGLAVPVLLQLAREKLVDVLAHLNPKSNDKTDSETV